MPWLAGYSLHGVGASFRQWPRCRPHPSICLQSEPHTEAYAAAKAGLLGLTHAQAVSLAHKVR